MSGSKNADPESRLAVTGALASGVTKINIATPSYGSSYSGAYVNSFYSLLTQSPRRGVACSFSSVDYADIVTARNYLISNFYFNKKDCSHILFIDDDMGFDVDLVFDMLALRRDVVGVLAPRRRIDLHRLHSLGQESFPRALAMSCEFVGTPGTADVAPGFVEVSECGAGILLVSRECVARMIEQLPAIVDRKRFKRMAFAGRFSEFLTPFDKIALEDRELSEDLSFCHRWTHGCGGRIYANVSRKVRHVTTLTLETAYQDLG